MSNSRQSSYTDPSGNVYNYTYVNNLPAGIEIPGTGTITTGAYKWTRPESVLLPGGGKQAMIYDPLMRTRSITAKDPGQNDLMAYAYTHDDLDNIIAKSTEHGDYEYGYDNLQRLVSADVPEEQGLTDEGFTYDAVGNRLSDAQAPDWIYNQNNELESRDNTSYEYDANGNLVKRTVNGIATLFFYNLEDRLERVGDEAGTVIAEYGYDPFGRRLWKEVGGTRTYFMYADEGLVGEYDAAGNEIKTYGWKPGGTWGTDPLFIKIGDEYYFYHNDHLGTPQKLTAVNGAIVWSAKYYSFGEAFVDPGSTVENNLRFAGQYFDEESGLHYNFHRFYDPEIGRYIRKDPVGILKGFNHLFTYSINNPLMYIDTLGLMCIKLGCIPTSFSISKTIEKKDITDWVLKGASGFGFDWESVTIGGIHCRWKKRVQIKDTYTVTTQRTCFKLCFSECSPQKIITYTDFSQNNFERTHNKTEQKDLEGAWGASLNWPKGGNVLSVFLDQATITNKEREKCNQMRKGGGF